MRCFLFALFLSGGVVLASSQGTGFFVNEGGDIVTCAHVVTNPHVVSVVTSDGINLPAKVKHLDHNLDICILNVKWRPSSQMAFTPSTKMELLADVVVLGFPLAGTVGSEITATKGNINAKRVGQSGEKILQIDAAINPGNSGGPVLSMDSSGVVGMAFFKIDSSKVMEQTGKQSERMNFAIPSEEIMAVLSRFGVPFSTRPSFRLAAGKMRQAEAATVMVLSEEKAGEQHKEMAIQFSADHLAASSQSDLARTVGFFADSVEYYGNGRKTSAFIREDMARYNALWPVRSFRFLGAGPYSYNDNLDEGKLRYRYAYNCESATGERAEGTASVTVVIRGLAVGNPRIFAISENNEGR